MSKEALDQLIRRAVADGAFRAKLLDKERVASATEGYDLTPDEVAHIEKSLAGVRADAGENDDSSDDD